jgi:hypothetical protein
VCWVAGKGVGFYNFSHPYCCWEGSESGSRIYDNHVVQQSGPAFKEGDIECTVHMVYSCTSYIY